MSAPGSIAEGQEFSSREAKLPCRFRDRGLVLLMAEDGWFRDSRLSAIF
jgi:hypothetical protein